VKARAPAGKIDLSGESELTDETGAYRPAMSLPAGNTAVLQRAGTLPDPSDVRNQDRCRCVAERRRVLIGGPQSELVIDEGTWSARSADGAAAPRLTPSGPERLHASRAPVRPRVELDNRAGAFRGCGPQPHPHRIETAEDCRDRRPAGPPPWRAHIGPRQSGARVRRWRRRRPQKIVSRSVPATSERCIWRSARRMLRHRNSVTCTA
jgi:hypothetical protein